jgi:hypothetical protein
VERNGDRYHVTKNHEAVVEPTVGMYHLSNLFNGDKLLGKALQHTQQQVAVPQSSQAFFVPRWYLQ